MTTFSQHYEESLYPFQNGVLNIVEKCDRHFYLTGGTAVSRGYYNHRYSDDLDFFTNGDENFSDHIENILQALQNENYSFEKVQKEIGFVRVYALHDGFSQSLKIDFVNDLPVHFGDIQKTKIFSRTDSIQNILTNKLSAIFRYEAKDIADIYEICLHEKFNWAEVISLAQQKENAVEAKLIYEIIESMPKREFDFAKIDAYVWNRYMAERLHDSDIRKEGIQQGIAQGEHKKAIETARNFLSLGVVTKEQIAQATGLSLAEVQELDS